MTTGARPTPNLDQAFGGQEGGQADLGCVDESADDPSGVKEFCRLHDLSDTLREATSLATSTFPTVQRLRVALREDPENGDRWLTVRVVARCTPGEATAAYEKFIDRWVASVPKFKRGLVRLWYGLE
jgi:hypothetical protein